VLYIWCAATNPGDPGIFDSTKNLKLDKHEKHSHANSDQGISHGGRPLSETFGTADNSEKLSSMLERKDSPSWPRFSGILSLVCLPFSCLCKRCLDSDSQPSEQKMCEEGMFFCSLCEAEVLLWSPFPIPCTALMYSIFPLGAIQYKQMLLITWYQISFFCRGFYLLAVAYIHALHLNTHT